MSVPEEKLPVYDDRVNYILRSLAAGISRDNLAKELKHKDYKTLDMYMRRRNFTWDRNEQNYKPVTTRLSKDHLIDEDIHTGKVSQVIESFNIEKDPKEVAQQLGFKDHKELAKYMTKKSYVWNESEENYVRNVGIEKEKKKKDSSAVSQKDNEKPIQPKRQSEKSDELLQLVKTLYEKLNINAEDPIIDRVPRYMIKGIAKNKTVPISHLLHQLIESFSEENHITHREIFEVALVDFFRKYGYKYEAELLFTNKQ